MLDCLIFLHKVVFVLFCTPCQVGVISVRMNTGKKGKTADLHKQEETDSCFQSMNLILLNWMVICNS